MRLETVMNVLLILFFVLGLMLALFPTLNGWRQDRTCRAIVKEFLDYNPGCNAEGIDAPYWTDAGETNKPSSVYSVPHKYPELWKAIRDYNTRLQGNEQAGLSDPAAYETDPICPQNYGFPDTAFGVISIPEIQVELPLFIGANADNMANGAAILGQTSIPIGGKSTNSVIAGHRGWNGYPYFLDIDLLEIGDEVIITNPWETLTFVVKEIQIISPDNVPAILIQPGRELVTLLSCHPVASGGKYRYLVFCERKGDA